MDFCDLCGKLMKGNAGCDECDKTDTGKEQDSDCAKIVTDAEGAEEEEDVPDEIKQQWEKEQLELKQKLILEDDDIIHRIRERSESESDSDEADDTEYYIGGVDISFVKGDNVNACAALVVVNFPDLEVVYEDYEMIQLTAPYIPGFLAFREAGFLVDLFDKLKQTQPQFIPQVLFVDGNGLIHPREFGLACHLGVLLDIPCVGVAKKLYQVDGLEKDSNHTDKIKLLEKGGDTFPLKGLSGKVLGMALRSCDKTTNPVYVSCGHKICLDSALWIVHRCCKFRIPEPVRMADINSREFLRVNFKPEVPVDNLSENES